MTEPFYLAGEWRTGRSELVVRSPYDQREVGRVARAEPADVLVAIDRAHAARHDLQALTRHERAQVLAEVALGLQQDKPSWAELISLESGKPLKDALHEVDRAVVTFTVAAEEAKRFGGEFVPLDGTAGQRHHWGLMQRVPLGLVTAITPFNAPLNLVAHKLAPAFAAGNAVLLKPALQTPLTALRLARLLHGAGLPAGALSVLTCYDQDADALIDDERIGALSFTGSQVGWQLKARAVRKQVTLELGGNGGVIVHDDADLELAVRGALRGAFASSGQRCISVQRILVQERLRQTFETALLAGVARLVTGDPLDPATDVGPLISEQAAARAQAWIEEAVAGGARLLAGGGRRGALLEPTVLADVPPTARVWCDEVFAPVTVLQSYQRFGEAIAQMNDARYGLQVGVFTRDLARVRMAFERLEYGGVMINTDSGYRAEHMPYGGSKASGFNREGVRYAMEGLTEPRMLVLNLDLPEAPHAA